MTSWGAPTWTQLCTQFQPHGCAVQCLLFLPASCMLPLFVRLSLRPLSTVCTWDPVWCSRPPLLLIWCLVPVQCLNANPILKSWLSGRNKIQAMNTDRDFQKNQFLMSCRQLLKVKTKCLMHISLCVWVCVCRTLWLNRARSGSVILRGLN